MKFYTILFLLGTPFASIAQKSQSGVTPAAVLSDGTVLPYDTDTKLITYQGVVEAPGLTKDQLYKRAHDWLARVTGVSITPATPSTTDQLGSIGSWPVTFSTMAGTYPAGFVQYTLTLYFKEGRYKYILTNLTHNSSGGDKSVPAAGPLEQPNVQLIVMGGKRPWQGVRKQADTNAQKVVTDLQDALKTPAKNPSDF